MKDYLNINEAAKACGLSIPTIRLKLERGLLPNAHQVSEGNRKTWRIPLSDLQAAGLLDSVKSEATPSQDQSQLVRDLELKLERLTAEANQLREQLAKAELREERALAEAFRAYQRQLETAERQGERRRLWLRRDKPNQAQEQASNL